MENSKPITMLYEELEDSLVQTLNDSPLPFFVKENVLKLLVSEVHGYAISQLNSDKKAYNKRNKEVENDKEE